MSGINDTDYLAAVMAIVDCKEGRSVVASSIAYVLNVHYPDDLLDDLRDLSKRGLLGATGEFDNGFPTTLTEWSITPEGRFEVYRR